MFVALLFTYAARSSCNVEYECKYMSIPQNLANLNRIHLLIKTRKSSISGVKTLFDILAYILRALRVVTGLRDGLNDRGIVV